MNFVAADAAADDFPSVSFTEISFNGLRCESCSTKLSIIVSIPAIIFVSGIYGGVGSSAAGDDAGDDADDDAGSGVGDGACSSDGGDDSAGDFAGDFAGDGAGGGPSDNAGGGPGDNAGLVFFCFTSSSSNPCLKRS